MDDRHIIALFQRDPAAGYDALLAAHTTTMLRMARRYLRSDDDQMEAYTLVAERLHANDHAALRGFTRGTSLLPWLSVVIANASRDVLRARRSVSQPQSVVKKLSKLEQAVFVAYFQQQYAPNEIVELLRTKGFPTCTASQVASALDRANELLSVSKRWALLAAHLTNEADASLDELRENGYEAAGAFARRPDDQLMHDERLAALHEAVDTLKPPEQLMLKLWFEQGMKGAEVARLIGLPEGASIYTRIRSVLRQLRRKLTEAGITT